MKMRDLLFAIGLISCLFSTSFASTGDWNKDTVVSANDPNLVMTPQGAPADDLVYCDKCGGYVRRSQARMKDSTVAYRTSTRTGTGAPTNDTGEQ